MFRSILRPLCTLSMLWYVCSFPVFAASLDNISFPGLCFWTFDTVALSAGIWIILVALPGTRDRCIFWRSQPGRHFRRLRWCVLVMLSRRRVVEFPLLGPMSLNGVRLWLLCLLLVIGGLVYES